MWVWVWVWVCHVCLYLNVQILSLSAVILANLCVSYIMSSQTEDAEELMRKIEKEEVGCVMMEMVCMLMGVACMLTCVQEKLSYEDPDRKLYHLCIVNLVIGTLYCAKGNYEFGIGRIMKSLEPYQRKVCVCGGGGGAKPAGLTPWRRYDVDFICVSAIHPLPLAFVSEFSVPIAHCTLQSLTQYSIGMVQSHMNSDGVHHSRLHCSNTESCE